MLGATRSPISTCFIVIRIGESIEQRVRRTVGLDMAERAFYIPAFAARAAQASGRGPRYFPHDETEGWQTRRSRNGTGP